MTSEKSQDNAQRIDAHIGDGLAHPPVDSSWTDTGSMSAGWGKGTGFFKYKMILPGVVMFVAQGLTCGSATVLDGTTILSNANGFAAGYRPGTAKTFPAYSDTLKVSPNTASFPEAAALQVQSGGGVQCIGIGAAATLVHCWESSPPTYRETRGVAQQFQPGPV